MSNSDNPYMGAEFEQQVLKWFNDNVSQTFDLHVGIPINNTKSKDYITKKHEFDIVSSAEKIAIECKRYTWTKSWNVPSAKMGVTNEAAFYLTCLPDKYQKCIVMLRSYNSKRDMTLAHYYYETYKHLLDGIEVLEFDPKASVMRCVNTGEIM